MIHFDGPSRRPALLGRISVAVGAGLVAWVLASLRLRAGGAYALGYDFTPHWWAADALRRGYSPYKVINGFSRLYPFNVGYLYLLPTAVILYPFAFLPLQIAMPIFTAISVGVFAFALTRDGWWRLPLLASLPLIGGAVSGQVVPLVTAALLVPALGWLTPMKYTIGAAGAAFTLSARYVLLASAVVLVSIAIWPWWPREWFADLHDVVGGPYYQIPVRITGGFLLLAVLVRWRRPEARMLFVMACVPQTMLFYDQLPLGLVARSYREALFLSVGSYGAAAVAIFLHGAGATDRAILFAQNAPIITACYYAPCAILVLLRSNSGDVPAWLDRATMRFPRWLRGERTARLENSISPARSHS